jgi:hypothetical protein
MNLLNGFPGKNPNRIPLAFRRVLANSTPLFQNPSTMNIIESNTLWLESWLSHLEVLKSFESETNPLLPTISSSAPSLRPDQSVHLASTGSGVAEALLKTFHDSIRFDRANSESGFEHFSSSGQNPTPSTGNLLRGEVVQVDPTLNIDWRRPVFVMITESDGDPVTVMPFSPLPIPATDGELLTGFDEEGLEVLCVWNITQIPRRSLDRHLKITQADESLVNDATALLNGLQHRQQISPELRNRIGPLPIRLSDEKQNYLDLEEKLLLSLTVGEPPR